MDPTLLLIAIPISLLIVLAQKRWANRADPDRQFGAARVQSSTLRKASWSTVVAFWAVCVLLTTVLLTGF